MSGPSKLHDVVSTTLGRFKPIKITGEDVIPYLFECPGCGEWLTLAPPQWEGRVSVNHEGCRGGYHETHNYAAEALPQIVRAVREQQ